MIGLTLIIITQTIILIQPNMPITVNTMLITNAMVLINCVPFTSLFFFFLRQIIENIKAIIPPIIQVKNILTIDHGNESWIPCTSDCDTKCLSDDASTDEDTSTV